MADAQQLISRTGTKLYLGDIVGVPMSGTTAKRPTATQVVVGLQYFDTDINKPVFVKAISGSTVTWVLATGGAA